MPTCLKMMTAAALVEVERATRHTDTISIWGTGTPKDEALQCIYSCGERYNLGLWQITMAARNEQQHSNR